MKYSIFWYISLCALLTIATVSGWNVWYSIAVAVNAILVLFDVVKRVRARR